MAFQYVDNPPEFQTVLGDIFTEEFMRSHTKFEFFEGFQYSSAVFLNWKSDPMIYDEDVFDAFVRGSTCFSGWEKMVCSAADLHFARQKQ